MDQEALISFFHLTSVESYHTREAKHFADCVFDAFYNDFCIVAVLITKRERLIEALRINDNRTALPSELFVLGFTFNVTEIKEDEPSSDDSSSSSYVTYST